jgi:hypothetical protein
MPNELTQSEKAMLWELSQLKASVRMIQNDIIRLTMKANGESDADVLRETRKHLRLVHEIAQGYYKESINGLAQHKAANFPPHFSDN